MASKWPFEQKNVKIGKSMFIKTFEIKTEKEKNMEEKKTTNETQKQEQVYKNLNKSSLIAMIGAAILATALIVVFGVLNQAAAMFAVAAVCLAFIAIYYFCQYVLVNKSWKILLCAIFELVFCVACIVLFILYSVGVI